MTDSLRDSLERGFACLSRADAAGNGTPSDDPSWVKSIEKAERKARQTVVYSWFRFHTEQAERHRKTLGELISYHEREAAKLSGAPANLREEDGNGSRGGGGR